VALQADLHGRRTAASLPHASTMSAWDTWDEEQSQTPEDEWAVYDNVYQDRRTSLAS